MKGCSDLEGPDLEGRMRVTGTGILTKVDSRIVSLGVRAQGALTEAGKFLRFCGSVVVSLPSAVRHPRSTLEQMMWIGASSLPLVAFISVFSGAVAAWQAAHNFADYVPLRYVGSAVGKSVMLELGPVLTAIVVAGRAGAAMAAELGTMTVTEQIDALRALGLKPVRILIAPRFLAALIALPLLTIWAAGVSLLGALAVVTIFNGLTPETFFFGVRLFYDDRDLFVGLIKAGVFGGWIALFGCWFGFSSGRGAEGVGRAAMSAVVWSDIAILVSGFFLSKLLLP
jgi:phospholipid/cholesterol/gamma-HCH transport system permease protein